MVVVVVYRSAWQMMWTSNSRRSLTRELPSAILPSPAGFTLRAFWQYRTSGRSGQESLAHMNDHVKTHIIILLQYPHTAQNFHSPTITLHSAPLPSAEGKFITIIPLNLMPCSVFPLAIPPSNFLGPGNHLSLPTRILIRLLLLLLSTVVALLPSRRRRAVLSTRRRVRRVRAVPSVLLLRWRRI